MLRTAMQKTFSSGSFAIYIFLIEQVVSFDPLVIPNFTGATLSSTLTDGYEAFRAVDGRPDSLQATPGGSCSHSAIGQGSAWLRIDLRRVYSLYQVQTWYRNDRSPQTNTERFQGYSIRVSNDTSLIPQQVCFQHVPSALPIPIPTSNNCTQVARYVWFYKDNPPVPSDGGNIFLEICEVQIIGCEINHYGENCTECGIGCATCDITSGCVNCLPGHLDPDCECPFGKYGRGCTQNCSGNCANDENCDIKTGECRNGCLPGYLGNACNQSCMPGFYGNMCTENCSGNCLNDDPCNHRDGSCDRGCALGWRGFQCNQTNRLVTSPSGPGPSGSTIAGITTGILFAIIIVGVAVVLVHRFQKKQTPEYKDFVYNQSIKRSIKRSIKLNRGVTNSSIKLVDNLSDEQEHRHSQISNASSMYYNTTRDSFFLASKNIRVSSISTVIKAKSKDSFRIFLKEFKDIPYGEQSSIPCTVAKEPQNKSRNRFKTTFPYDHSRLILQSNENDYINANFIRDLEGNRKYIASQGPKPNTLSDHWLMIWQENVNVIIMLTNLVEGSKKKCGQYWPDSEEEEMTYGDISVRLLKEKHYAYYVIRHLQARRNSESTTKDVIQMHYTHWPDHGVPDPVDLMIFHKHVVRIQEKSKNSVLLVHCSAGIGRTGTFLALDELYRYGCIHGTFNAVDYVKTMREDRMNMIQNVDQYVCLHFALNESFKGKQRVKDKASFIKKQRENPSGSELTSEFEELISIKKQYIDADKEAGISHQELNYTKDVLPVDRFKVALSSYVEGRTYYYNAVFVSSFCENNALIAAQYPVEGQAVDFLRLLVDHESNTLVSINPLKDIPSAREWLPRENPIAIESYSISKLSSSNITPSVRKTDIIIKNDESETQEVSIYELTTWKMNDVIPRDLQMVADVIDHVMKRNKSSETVNPVTIVSKDGATGCGMVCAVYNTLQQLQQDDEVDMFSIVRQLQIRRPEMISSKEEYIACHKIVASTLEDFPNEPDGETVSETGETSRDLYSNVEIVYANG